MTQKKLLVAIPCLNEEKTIRKVIDRIPRNIKNISRVDVLVIDDGSNDYTAVEAKKAGAHVLKHHSNHGVGFAFQSAVSFAIKKKYDFMVNIDGDGQFDPLDINKLIDPIIKNKADMVTASRFIDVKFIPKMPKIKLYGNYMMSYLISKLVRKKFYDVSCGFRCYSRESLFRLNLHGAFTYTQETFLDFAVKKLLIKEIPIKVIYFEDRKSRIADSIIKYAINTAIIIFRGYRDYFPLRFFWSIAFVFLIPSIIMFFIFFLNYALTGRFTGYLFAGFGAAFFAAMAIVFFLIGIVTDMLDRIRVNQERVLYLLKNINL
jgi:glycosyltransferase involved in cell wall biosynthesis